MLRVTLLGNLGADPEVRYTQKGAQMVSFNVAVNQVRMGRDGERQENTEWFRIRVSGRQSEFAQRLTKGSKVVVLGRLDISHFQGKDGESRTGFDVWADDIQSLAPGRAFGPDMDAADSDQDVEPAMAGASSLGANGAARSASANGRPRQTPRTPQAQADSSDLEDLPF